MNPVQGAGTRGSRDSLEALRQGRVRGDQARLHAAARLLEGTFYQEMFKAMRATLPGGGALPESRGEQVFAEMLDQHVSDQAAMKATRGIGEALYLHFARSLPSGAPPSAGPPTPLREEV